MPEYEITSRGFKHYPDIRTAYGHVLRVYESSAAMEPCLWLAVGADGTANQENGDIHVHLTLPQAAALRNRLDEAMEGHYQLEGDSSDEPIRVETGDGVVLEGQREVHFKPDERKPNDG